MIVIKTVNILGVPYTILYKEKSEDPKFEQCVAYCDYTTHEIAISIPENNVMNLGNIDVDIQRVLRHEIVHAFAFESGLGHESNWAMDEEMTDWIARQFPKMAECFNQISAV